MPLLAAAELAYRYPQNNRGVGPLSFTVESGEMVLLRGPSGSGKSTLARCLTGFVPHLYQGSFTGAMRINGTPTTEQPLWKISETVGLLLQNPDSRFAAARFAEWITNNADRKTIAATDSLATALVEAAQGLTPPEKFAQKSVPLPAAGASKKEMRRVLKGFDAPPEQT